MFVTCSLQLVPGWRSRGQDWHYFLILKLYMNLQDIWIWFMSINVFDKHFDWAQWQSSSLSKFIQFSLPMVSTYTFLQQIARLHFVYERNKIKLNPLGTCGLTSIIQISSFFFINITVMDIIHCTVLYLKHNVSETRLCLSSAGTFSGGRHLKTMTDSSPQNVTFKITDRTVIKVEHVFVVFYTLYL